MNRIDFVYGILKTKEKKAQFFFLSAVGLQML